MVVSCQKCGRQIRDEDAVFCPYCANPIRPGIPGKTDFPTAGGVLLIIAVSVCVFVGIFALALFAVTYSYDYYRMYEYFSPKDELLLAGTVGVLAFVYGLAGGIFSLKRKRFVHCLAGGVVTMFEGLLLIIAFAHQWGGLWVVGVSFGVPVVILSAAALLFISISNAEYR